MGGLCDDVIMVEMDAAVMAWCGPTRDAVWRPFSFKVAGLRRKPFGSLRSHFGHLGYRPLGYV